MIEDIRNALNGAGYTEIEIAKIISIYNEAENKGIPFPFYYALTKFNVGM